MLKNKLKDVLGNKSLYSVADETEISYAGIHKIFNKGYLDDTSFQSIVKIVDCLKVDFQDIFEKVKYSIDIICYDLNDEEIHTFRDTCIGTCDTIERAKYLINSHFMNMNQIPYSRVVYLITEINENTEEYKEVDSVEFDFDKIKLEREMSSFIIDCDKANEFVGTIFKRFNDRYDIRSISSDIHDLNELSGDLFIHDLMDTEIFMEELLNTLNDNVIDVLDDLVDYLENDFEDDANQKYNLPLKKGANIYYEICFDEKEVYPISKECYDDSVLKKIKAQNKKGIAYLYKIKVEDGKYEKPYDVEKVREYIID